MREERDQLMRWASMGSMWEARREYREGKCHPGESV